jgi:hypothetical protein
VGTRNAFVVHLSSSLFDEVEPEQRRGTLLVQGLADEAHGVAMHPARAELAIACYNGAVYLWDLATKARPCPRGAGLSLPWPRGAVFCLWRLTPARTGSNTMHHTHTHTHTHTRARGNVSVAFEFGMWPRIP